MAPARAGASSVRTGLQCPAGLRPLRWNASRRSKSAYYSAEMERGAELLEWRLTRPLLAAGAVASATGAFGLGQGPSTNFALLLVAVGIALVVVSTSRFAVEVATAQIWSVSSVRVRASASPVACLPFTPRTPRGISPPQE